MTGTIQNSLWRTNRVGHAMTSTVVAVLQLRLWLCARRRPQEPSCICRSATPGTMTLKVGTNLWMAPEVMAGGAYDRDADIFR